MSHFFRYHAIANRPSAKIRQTESLTPKQLVNSLVVPHLQQNSHIATLYRMTIITLVLFQVLWDLVPFTDRVS